MTNDLTTHSAGLVNYFSSADTAAAFANSLAGAANFAIEEVGANANSHLNFKDGVWTFGSDKTPVHETDVFAINPLSFKHGHIAFEDMRAKALAVTSNGDVCDQLRPVTETLPRIGELPVPLPPRNREHTQAEWKFQMGVDMTAVDGPNKGVELSFATNSFGGIRMLAKLAGEIARRVHSGEAKFIPLVVLDTDPYYNKRFEKEIHTPTVIIFDWISFEDMTKTHGVKDAPASKSKPVNTTSKTTAVVAREEVRESSSEAPARIRGLRTRLQTR
jgi:hypothetical protein